MGLWKRLFGPDPAPQPRMRDVLERLDVLEGDVGGLRKRVNQLSGLVTGAMRREKEAQEPAGPTNGEEPEVQYPPQLLPPTSHLSRRFRAGG